MEWASYSYWPSFVWGLMVLAGFVGWGCAAARVTRVDPNERDWPICASWGMAIVIALGGVLALLGFANRLTLIIIATAGCAFAIAWFRPRGFDWGAALILGVTLLLFYLPAVASREAEPYDDYLAYFPYVKRFLATGTLLDPFGFRRLTTYGGQSLLDALTTAFGSEKNMNLLDRGIAMVILGGLAYGLFRRFFGTRAAVACTLAVLCVPIARHNTMSQATGIVLWIALFRTVRIRSGVLGGILLAALCTLRSNYVLCAVILMGALLLPIARRSLLSMRAWWRMAAAASVATAAWALVLYRSSGTIFYPLSGGYQRPGYSYSIGMTISDRVHAMVGLLTDPNVLFLVVPLILAIVLIRGDHVPFSIAVLATSLLVAVYMSSADQVSAFRYLQPLTFGALLIAAPEFARAKRIAYVVGCFMLPVFASYAVSTVKLRAAAVASIPAEITDRAPPFPKQDAAYRQLDAALPRGASVYAVLPLPSLLDYNAHKIYNADFIGCASPPPGMPFFRGPGELKRYLTSLGIDYIAYNRFDHPEVETGYWRDWWRDRAALLNPVLGPIVPYVLDLMDNVDRLASVEEVVFRSNDLVLLHLRRDAAVVSVAR